MQMLLMIAIAVTTGIFAAGCVWFGSDLMYKLGYGFMQWYKARKLRKEAEALLEQANEPADRPE